MTTRAEPSPGTLPAGWPTPDDSAAAHSERLCKTLADALAENGNWMSFRDWMEHVLYSPGLGYYSAGATRFGAAGDFVTAPEVSPLFGRTLARQCGDSLAACAGDTILELGPGRGMLARDILRAMQQDETLPARYLMLDRSGTLREEQAQTLSVLPDEVRARVQWLDRLPDSPINGLILANEVLDALPVERFRREASGVQQLGVRRAGDSFGEACRAAPARLAAQVEQLEDDLGRRLEPGYVSELCPDLRPWISALSTSLQRGLMLFIDYGYTRSAYYHPERRMGTLRCHYRHRAHDDWLLLPGLQDLTASVDFTAVALAADAAGLDVLGYAPQSHFLMASGLTELLACRPPSSSSQVALTQQAKALMLPSEMGERFQALALGRNFPAPVPGFQLYNHLKKL
ncbi:SAM-dependent methyltransferase [Methylonatrum kenyense]|uniref:class I SAM-dependent methyltransferase n=1 Tax=Methylonatrum kenyense TaxID=455253 RepID=UPI0020BDA453|nr:SAM-dependent methyltransferase [Methylonatrum kenyense]MCK8515395.1 SAM-dependent methyltransferase [Methylonatrum kenyense]